MYVTVDSGYGSNDHDRNHGHYHYFAAFVPWSQAFPRFRSATLTPAPLTPLAVLWGGLLNTPWAAAKLPNASLIAGFARQLERGGIEGATGHRHYWRSDYSVLRRPATRLDAKTAPAPGRCRQNSRQCPRRRSRPSRQLRRRNACESSLPPLENAAGRGRRAQRIVRQTAAQPRGQLLPPMADDAVP